MRTIFFLSALFLVSGCNQGSENSSSKEDSTILMKPASTDAEGVKPGGMSDTLFKGLGNEPFWAVYVIKNKEIVFHPADGNEIRVPYVEPSAIDSITKQYSSGSKTNHLVLTVIKKECSDGMSDNIHPYTVELKIDKDKYAGCGRFK